MACVLGVLWSRRGGAGDGTPCCTDVTQRGRFPAGSSRPPPPHPSPRPVPPLVQAKQNVEVLKQAEVIRNVQNILQVRAEGCD